MLQPKKHLDLDTSTLRVAALMLRELSRTNVIGFEKLRARIAKRAGPDAEINFLPSLNFLFLLGKVDYHEKNDIIELRR